MDNKKIAKYALSFIGGTPKVERFYNEDESKTIDIMTCTGGKYKDIITLATIGLSGMDIGLSINGTPLRVELMITGLAGNDALGNVLSTAAFGVMDDGYCNYGMVIRNVFSDNGIQSLLNHVVLLSPVFWENYEVLSAEDRTVAWLLAIPISESEYAFIEKNGIAAFDKLLEDKGADVFDFNREPII